MVVRWYNNKSPTRSCECKHTVHFNSVPVATLRVPAMLGILFHRHRARCFLPAVRVVLLAGSRVAKFCFLRVFLVCMLLLFSS